MSNKRNCDCEVCKNMLPFDLPEEIIKATIEGNLVIFAGAGTSTETKQIFLDTMYEEIFDELKLDSNLDIDFPSLMSLYCKNYINGRQKLLQKIKSRFDYCHQFQELYHQASNFHKELSSIYHIQSIVTTNWDDYFERESGAVPIVIPEDFAFHNMPDRKVYKIHGSISNYGTIVATKEDYDKCYKNLNRGIIGSYLKTILATKTVVFIGYSFRDYDFLRIYNYLQKELKEILPHCFLVTLASKVPDKIQNPNLTVINADGAYFISAIRKHLEGSKYLFPKEKLGDLYLIKKRLHKIHSETSELLVKKKQSNIVYCAFYQDGISHALSYLNYHADSGLSFFPPKIFASIDSYKDLKKKNLKRRNYADVAYIEGYISGLMAMVYGEDYIKEFCFWFLHGVGPVEREIFMESVEKNEFYHSGAEKFGEKHFAKALDDSEIVFHHRPFVK